MLIKISNWFRRLRVDLNFIDKTNTDITSKVKIEQIKFELESMIESIDEMIAQSEMETKENERQLGIF